MVVKKVTLGAFLLMCPWLATAGGQGQRQGQGQQQQGGESIEDIYRKCKNFVANEQIMKFSKDILCTGNYTFFETTRGAFGLRKNARMSAQTSCKDNDYGTERSHYSSVRAHHAGSCTQHVQKEMAVPEGFSLPITLENCEDINEATIFRLCQDEVHDYCDGNYVVDGAQGQQQQQGQAQQQQQRQDGQCVLRTVDVIDTCPKYFN